MPQHSYRNQHVKFINHGFDEIIFKTAILSKILSGEYAKTVRKNNGAVIWYLQLLDGKSERTHKTAFKERNGFPLMCKRYWVTQKINDSRYENFKSSSEYNNFFWQ